MSLSEAQVLRYSRQILLAEVGGAGQEKLLHSGAQLVGRGAAQATAAAYLVAGGISVWSKPRDFSTHERLVGAEECGFLFRDEDAGRPFAGSLASAVAELNSDGLSAWGEGSLGEVPAEFESAGDWVALGWIEQRGEVVYRSKLGCARCFKASLRGLSSVPVGPMAILVGSIGALVFQHLCLDLSDDLGAISIGESGAIATKPVRHCPGCT